jgi:hypothetical protein
MQTLGINYDTGVVVGGTSTRVDFDDGTVRRELEIIAGDLHANAVRVTGDRVDRLEVAARHASAAGMQVWFSPFLSDLGPDELVERLAGIAERAERLRRAGVDIVLVLGGEISLFCSGFVPGEGLQGRLATMTDPATWSTPDGLAALEASLARARDALRTVATRARAPATPAWPGSPSACSTPSPPGTRRRCPTPARTPAAGGGPGGTRTSGPRR